MLGRAPAWTSAAWLIFQQGTPRASHALKSVCKQSFHVACPECLGETCLELPLTLVKGVGFHQGEDGWRWREAAPLLPTPVTPGPWGAVAGGEVQSSVFCLVGEAGLGRLTDWVAKAGSNTW